MATLGIPQNTIAVLQKYHFNFQKKFGQNFLIDPHVLEKIVEAAGVTKDDFVLEIGPGIGTMTQYLCENAREVTAVEIDTNLIPILEDTLSAYDNVTVINQDILKLDIAKLAMERNGGKPIKVVANLPYYITSKIITKIVSSSTPINRLVAMVQKEVALKLCSEEKSPLKMMIDYVGDVQYELNVPRHVFMPAPHVDSAVISIHKERVISQELIDLIEASYTAKRKTLYNNLKSLYHDQTKELLESCGIPANKRAEELNIDDYIRILERSHTL